MSRDDFVARFIADLCASSTNSVKSELTTIKTIFLHLLLFAKLTWWDKARSFFFVVTEIENCLHYRIYFVLLYCLFSTHMCYVSCHHLKLQHEYSTRCQIIIIFFHETLEYRWRKSSERNMWVKHIDDSFLFTTDDICTVDYESSMEYLIYIYIFFLLNNQLLLSLLSCLCDNTSDDEMMTTMKISLDIIIQLKNRRHYYRNFSSSYFFCFHSPRRFY
jgi:hypothetical protein